MHTSAHYAMVAPDGCLITNWQRAKKDQHTTLLYQKKLKDSESSSMQNGGVFQLILPQCVQKLYISQSLVSKERRYKSFLWHQSALRNWSSFCDYS